MPHINLVRALFGGNWHSGSVGRPHHIRHRSDHDDGGSAVNALASFTLSSNTITIQLLNLQSNPGDVGQLISGVEFDPTNLGVGSLSSTMNSATENSFGAGGDGAPTADQQSSKWITKNLGAKTLTLCEICTGGGGGGPSQLIIGGPDPATGNSQLYTRQRRVRLRAMAHTTLSFWEAEGPTARGRSRD